MEAIARDLKFAARLLLKNKTFTIIAVLTLGIGIGGNTAMFAVLNSVLLRSLPYPEPDRIVRVGRSFQADDLYTAAEDKFLFWREHSRSFEVMAAYQPIIAGMNLSGGGEAQYVAAMRVTADFFRVLGVSNLKGRGFTEEEDSPGADRVAVISDRLWKQSFAGDPAVIGRTISLDSVPHSVIGVLPTDFYFVQDPDVLVSLRAVRGIQQAGENCLVIARLRTGVDEGEARAEMKLIADQYRSVFPQGMSQRESVNVFGYHKMLVRDVRLVLFVLFGAVGFVLLIACANVAGLQLTRSAARRREFAIRGALGAGRLSIGRQMLTEAGLLSLLGGAMGLTLAVWGVDLLWSVLPQGLIPGSPAIAIDWRVLAFTLVAAVIATLVSGFGPVFQAGKVDLQDALKESSGKGVVGSGRVRARSAIVVGEIALSLVLLAGAALMLRTFANLTAIDPGFDPENVLTFQVAPSGPQYDSTAQLSQFVTNAFERLRAVPGVETVATSSNIPLASPLNLPIELENKLEQSYAVEYRMISPGFFDTLRIPILKGRDFGEADAEGATPVVLVSESLARKYFPETDPVGERIFVARRMGEFGEKFSRTIIGVVGDVKQFGLADAVAPTVYVPLAQVPSGLMLQLRQWSTTSFLVRSGADPMALQLAAKGVVASLDPNLPLRNVRSMEQVLRGSVGSQRFNMLLLVVFAGTGLILSAVGVYGVVSHSVAQRTHEFGLRMALGAEASDVTRMVLRQAMTLAAAGLTLGLLAALAVTRALSSMLYEVSATDPLTLGAVALMLTLVVALACYAPARRAARVDPMIALRYE